MALCNNIIVIEHSLGNYPNPLKFTNSLIPTKAVK